MLARRAPCGDALWVEQQQPAQAQVRRDPGECQLHEIAGLYQQQHGGDGGAKPPRKGPLAGLSVEIRPRITDYDPTDKGN
jgi:hypothetical protein